MFEDRVVPGGIEISRGFAYQIRLRILPDQFLHVGSRRLFQAQCLVCSLDLCLVNHTWINVLSNGRGLRSLIDLPNELFYFGVGRLIPQVGKVFARFICRDLPWVNVAGNSFDLIGLSFTSHKRTNLVCGGCVSAINKELPGLIVRCGLWVKLRTGSGSSSGFVLLPNQLRSFLVRNGVALSLRSGFNFFDVKDTRINVLLDSPGPTGVGCCACERLYICVRVNEVSASG